MRVDSRHCVNSLGNVDFYIITDALILWKIMDSISIKSWEKLEGLMFLCN
jgi:hypothetical protein